MAIRLKEPKPLKPLRPIRWKRETTTSESEFSVRRIWTSKAGMFQIVECTYKHPYKYPRRFLALHFNGEAFVPVSNGHKKRPWAKRACEQWNRKLYAAGQARYEEAKKRYEAALERQAARDKEKRKAEKRKTTKTNPKKKVK